MAAEEGQEETDPPRGPGAPAWAGPVHRGAQALAAASLVLVLVLGARYRDARLSPDPAAPARLQLPLLLALLALALLGSVAAFRPERGRVPDLVRTMAACSVALAGALALAWFFADAAVRADHWAGTPVTTQAEVDAALAADPAPTGAAPPLLVPTGVMVQSLEFLGADNVQVTGYVWQKYGPTIPDDVARGVVFPEAITEAYGAEEAYRVTGADGGELVGWYFHATFRQPFDYRRYPFDRQDAWLRLWHPNAERGVQLVPDLASYRDLDPRSLPGIEEAFVYGGWEPEGSGFSYVVHRYNTTFGFDAGFAEAGVPELYFNLALRRAFLGPFVDQVLFAAAVALMLFLVLALTTSDEDLKTRFGIGPAAVLGTASGLLFAVILKHGQLRGAIGQHQVAYLEALPFLFYLLIPLVALNAIVLASPWDVRFVGHRHNLLPKLLYWPLLLGLLLAITLAALFP